MTISEIITYKKYIQRYKDRDSIRVVWTKEWNEKSNYSTQTKSIQLIK